MRRKNAPRLIFDKVKNESLSEGAVKQIENLILSGVLREGDMLPGERELSEQFGISRPKVREAVHQLADCNLLIIKTNGGVYVAQLGSNIMSPALIDLYNRSASAIKDNLEYRREQEGFASRLAAQRSTRRDREELRRIISEMRVADANKDNVLAAELDLQLHQVIAFSAHNHTLNHMITALYDLNRSSLFYNRDELMNLHIASKQLFAQHLAIVEAICQGAPDKAEKAAHLHIDYVCELVDEAFEQRMRETHSAKLYSTIQK